MKTRNLIATMMFISSLLFISCEENEMNDNEMNDVGFDFEAHDYRVQNVLYPKDSKLKCLYPVYSDGSRPLRPQTEYTYDEAGRISRVDWDFEAYKDRTPLWPDGTPIKVDEDLKHYDIYQYNENGQLRKISSYEEYIDNFPDLYRTVSYFYDDKGNKIREQTESSEWSGVRTISYLYDDKGNKIKEQRESSEWYGVEYYLYKYDATKLIKKELYDINGRLYNYTVYEYNGNLLAKVKSFTPNGSKSHSTTEYFYEQNLLIYTISYVKDPNYYLAGDERRYYDKNDNLTKTISFTTGSGYSQFEYEYE